MMLFQLPASCLSEPAWTPVTPPRVYAEGIVVLLSYNCHYRRMILAPHPPHPPLILRARRPEPIIRTKEMHHALHTGLWIGPLVLSCVLHGSTDGSCSSPIALVGTSIFLSLSLSLPSQPMISPEFLVFGFWTLFRLFSPFLSHLQVISVQIVRDKHPIKVPRERWIWIDRFDSYGVQYGMPWMACASLFCAIVLTEWTMGMCW